MITDNDFYAFTMSQWAKEYFQDTQVRYQFQLRSPVNLLDRIRLTELQARIDEFLKQPIVLGDICNLKANPNSYIFSTKYLCDLLQTELPSIQARQLNNKLSLEYEGPWWLAMLLETPLLAIINELWNQYQNQESSMLEILDQKIAWLQQRPYIKFFEFGTRRRYSLDWQMLVLAKLKNELSPGQFLGTSNPYFASLYDIPVRGTMAHQMFMVDTALGFGFNETPRAVLQHTLQSWQELYANCWDGHLLIALTDTFGTDWWLNNVDPQTVEQWWGFRQDSGDPLEWGHKLIKWAAQHNIDLKTKVLCFSDGLDLTKMDQIYSEFSAQSDIVFGWGTNLTNDSFESPLSMVIKPIACKGPDNNDFLPCIKLSDNLAKAVGSAPVVEYYKTIFGYQNEFSQECKY